MEDKIIIKRNPNGDTRTAEGKVISNLIFGAMILLPLYFNYWR